MIRLCVIILFFTYGLAETENVITKCPRVCKCHDKTAICGNHKHGLTSIPSVPAYITSFTLLNGNIPTINRSILSPISNCSLRNLALVSNGIKILSEDAFTDFQELQKFDLSGNNIPVSLLKVGFRSIGNNLKHINLSNMSINSIPIDLLPTRKSQNVTKFVLRYNNLNFLNESIFETMPSLSVLDVSYNQIEFLSYRNLRNNLNISTLNLGHNWLGEVPDFCWKNGTQRYNRLRNLNIENNNIRFIDISSFFCLKYLRNLTLNGNLVQVLPNNVFSSLPKLFSLDLSYLLQLKYIKEFAFNSSISVLRLSFNKKITKFTFPDGHFPFIYASNLKQLYIMNTRLILTRNLFRAMLLQLKTVEILNLRVTKINGIPPNTLCHLPALKKLDLQGNYMSKWGVDTFRNVTHLEYLNLDGNGINIIKETSFPVEMRSKIKQINLSNNDFLCTCELLWFRTWMKEVIKDKTVLFVNYPQKYYCKNPAGKRLDTFNPTEKLCEMPSTFVIPVAVTGTVFVIVAMAVTVLLYRNRWNIRYCFYTRRRRQYQQLPGRNVEIKYKAFVSCDSEDMDWMMDEVAAFLENELGFKLCIHRRDFEGAKMIIDNIMDCMEQSEKIILIISNKFATSKWCQCELKIAINRYFETEQPLVVIIREAVHKTNLTQPLKALFETTTYIEWDEDGNTRTAFRCHMADIMECECT